ncbi:methyltransferase [Pseudonocardia sp. Ae717_Ps2]|uniref:class I SAM-dependent methyltransferase n=1 Tax=unclassified Pseudonocardia TaxID=2619320 RepID=UPI00094B57A5|nr:MULTISPECIES: class I SAM-dependent methyltransferase [unclassified Pseudonocardia]OLM29223.1 methyltransferase [Pseudonocardia sp. Ae717_Ps2]
MVSHALYKDHAHIYAQHSDRSGPNAYYERPAMLRLAGDLTGQRVLELGCAAGALTTQLIERGAAVIALDREPRLVELARQRTSGQATVSVADLEEPLDSVGTGSIDLVIASLVLHYLPDWRPLLAELSRCLAPGGALLFSVHHPINGWALCDKADYHRTEQVHETWDLDGQEVTATLYRRPVSAIFGPLLDAGYIVDAVEEPQPVADAPLPEGLRTTLRTAPVFLFVRARRPARSLA